MTSQLRHIGLAMMMLSASSIAQSAPPLTHNIVMSAEILVSTCELNLPSSLTFGDHIAREFYGYAQGAAVAKGAHWFGEPLTTPWLTGCESGETIIVTQTPATATSSGGATFAIGIGPLGSAISTTGVYRLTADSQGDAYPTHAGTSSASVNAIATGGVAPGAELTSVMSDYHALAGDLSGAVNLQFTYE
jgi:type 1 fimbria pilin